jgi:hypothetical protein
MTLFEPATVLFSPMTIKYLSSDWPGVFRYQMLHLMPAEALGKHFDAQLGCPTKELYGMAGDCGLVGDFAGVEPAPPLDGLAQGPDDGRRTGRLGRPGQAYLAAAGQNRIDDLAGGHPPRQGGDAAVLEGRVRPQGDLDGLLAVRGWRRAAGRRKAVVDGDMDDPEEGLRLGPTAAAWNTVTFRKSSYRPGARAVNSPARRCPFAALCQGSNTVTFGIDGLSRKRGSDSVNGHAARRACRVVAVTRCPQRVPPRRAALSVRSRDVQGAIVTRRVALEPRMKASRTLALSR